MLHFPIAYLNFVSQKYDIQHFENMSGMINRNHVHVTQKSRSMHSDAKSSKLHQILRLLI